MRGQRWLMGAGLVYLALGIGGVLLTAWPAGFARFNQLASGTGAATPATGAVIDMYGAVAGGMLAGFGAFLYGLARALDRGPRALAGAALLGVLTWYALDTLGSLAHGAWPNAISNTLLLAIPLPPLLVLRRGQRAEAGAITPG